MNFWLSRQRARELPIEPELNSALYRVRSKSGKSMFNGLETIH